MNSARKENTYIVQKMDCPTEERLIRNRLEGMEGMEELRFNLMQRELTVKHRLESDEPIFTALQELRMEPQRQGSEENETTGHATTVSTRTKWLVGLSGVMAIAAEIIGWTTDNEQSAVVIALSVLAIALGGMDTVRKGITAIKTFTLNINFLMMVAIAGATLIGE
jgi:Cd2+/Zn2+-exporting ATPase